MSNGIDFAYNFLSDVGCGDFNAGSLSVSENGAFHINGKPYKDPDDDSKRLYENFMSIYDNRCLPNGNFLKCIGVERPYRSFGIKAEVISKETGLAVSRVFLGSDYIGASKNSARETSEKLSAYEIGVFLESTRTFGGHVIWPRQTEYGKRHKGLTINQARGFWLEDRIDLTLFDLNEWYDKRPCRLQRVFDEDQIWLSQFECFKKFITFFCFGMYVDETFKKVKNLCTYDGKEGFEYLTCEDVSRPTIPKDKATYIKYANASVHLTSLRNNSLGNWQST